MQDSADAGVAVNVNDNFAGVHIVFHRKVYTAFNKREPKWCVQAVLLCKRTQDAPIHPAHWSLPGGERCGDEPADETLRREVNEELETVGLDAVISQKQCLPRVNVVRGGQEPSPILYFSAPLDRDMDCLRLRRDPKHNKVEAEGLGWFTEAEIHHLVMRPEDRAAVRHFFEKSSGPSDHSETPK